MESSIEGSGVDFFATGGSQMELGLDLNYFPYAQGKGINLSSKGQSLQQSYQKAKQVFERVKPKTIKFVLIDLSTCLIHDSKDIANLTPTIEDYFKLCFENVARPVGVLLPLEQAFKNTFNAEALKTFRNTVNRVGKNYKLIFIDLLDVKSVNVAATTTMLSVCLYLKGILSSKDLYAARKDFFNVFEKYFPINSNFPSYDKPLIQHVFCLMAYEDFNRLSKTMPKETCLDLMAQVFYELTYSYLANLADIFPKEDYNELTTRIFNMTAENIRRKDKIKVGFYFTYSSHWSGDDLYNVFAQDEYFEPTVFMIMDKENELNRNESINDLKKFKTHGLNVFEMKKDSRDVPKQNILFRLSPYSVSTRFAFRLVNLKVKDTLLVNTPYSFTIILGSLLSHPLYNVLWKMFFPSTAMLERYKN